MFHHASYLKHTADKIKAYMDGKIHNEMLSVMDWSTKSSDLNIIEVLWERKTTFKEKLWNIFKTSSEVLLQTS